MTEQSHEQPVRPGCAHAFQDIAVHYARLSERQVAMDEKLDAISEAVLGNGDPARSILARLQRAETVLKIIGAALLAIPAVVAALVAVLQTFKG